MSGDCGHGWGYHSRGPSGPCDKCDEEADLLQIARARQASSRPYTLRAANNARDREWSALNSILSSMPPFATFAEADAIRECVRKDLRHFVEIHGG